MKEKFFKIETKQAPAVVGPYSQALRVDLSGKDLLFVSGQLPQDPATGKLIEGGMELAARQTLDNVEAILKAAHCSFNDVVRVDIFLKDFNDFQKMNEEYKKRFDNATFPARQTVQVAKLPLDASIEISCIAVVGRAKKKLD